MKNAKRMLALLLVLVTMFVMAPAVFAADAALPAYTMLKTDYEVTVDMGLEFRYVGLPNLIATESQGDLAKITWEKGNYNPNKVGDYKVVGKAVPDRDGYTLTGTKVTGTIHVIDAPFGLGPLQSFKKPNRMFRSVIKGQYKNLVATPVMDNYCIEDYDWSYRWYVSDNPNKPFKFFRSGKYCELNHDLDDGYYYCKVTRVDKKTHEKYTMTTNTCLVSGSEPMYFELTSDKMEIKPGESFTLRGEIGFLDTDGNKQEVFTTTKFTQTFKFRSSSEGVKVNAKNSTQQIMDGVAYCDVTTDAQTLKNVDSIEVTLNMSGGVSPLWGNIPNYDVDRTLTIKVIH